MFISGGENIHPEEIEAVLHDFGIFSIVIPIPNDRYGQRPVAFVLVDLSEDLQAQIQLAFTDTFTQVQTSGCDLSLPKEVDTYKPSRRTLQKIALELDETTIDLLKQRYRL